MSAANNSDQSALPIDFIETFPGLFNKNSEADKALLARRRYREQHPHRDLRLTGERVQHGVLSESELGMVKGAIPIEQVFGPVADILDVEFLDKIDYRLRFCRAILSIQFALDWDEAGNPVWELEAPPEGDPLDQVGIQGVNLQAGTHEFYALKILRHFRRFERLYESGKTESIGIWRELILFGETWSQARFALNLGKNTVTGSKQNKVLADHRGTAHAKQRKGVQARRDAISTLLRESNRNLTGGALEQYLCKRLLDRFGIKASPRTIRRDLSEIPRR